MTMAPYRVVLLDTKQHDRTRFSSRSEALNTYFREKAGQDVKKRVSACHVAIDGSNEVVGYYTLSASSILIDQLPTEIVKKLPRYPTVPAMRLGRLAVDQSCQGQGLGGALLVDALMRASSPEFGVFAMVVDAKDQAAAAFYAHHGFLAFSDSPMTLFLPLGNIQIK